MKTVQLLETETVKAKDVLRIVMENPQQQGANVEQIRRRCKVLDALDKVAPDSALALEDADFDFMVTTLKTFSFSAATKDLLTVLDALTAGDDGPVINLAARKR
jgi:hypothetical protein